MSDPTVTKVAELYVVSNDEELLGVECAFDENVRNKLGAAQVLDLTRAALNTSGWVTQTVMRVEDAQDDGESEVDSVEDSASPPQPTVGVADEAS